MRETAMRHVQEAAKTHVEQLAALIAKKELNSW